MVDFPSYIKVLPGNATRRSNASTAGVGRPARLAVCGDGSTVCPDQAEVVSLVYRENHASAVSSLPTPEEAAEALRRLQEDLPDLGQAVDELHSNLDRRRVLDLLAPLLEV